MATTVDEITWAAFYSELHQIGRDLRKMLHEPEWIWYPETEYIFAEQMVIF